jgi:hypothetical protein
LFSLEKQPDTAAQTMPNPNLQADAERLRQATAKAAEARKSIASLIESSTPSVPQSRFHFFKNLSRFEMRRAGGILFCLETGQLEHTS